MDLGNENYPYAFYQGRVVTFKSSLRMATSYFGGPGQFVIRGKKHGPRPLHHIVTLWIRDIEVPCSHGFVIPFFYGLSFEGCDLEYKRVAHSAIEVTEISPSKSSHDWPYDNYPYQLPYIRLEVREKHECSLSEFSDSVMQGIKTVADAELIVVVPANPELRMSIWGPAGDAEQVQMVFRYDTGSCVTRAYSACT